MVDGGLLIIQTYSFRVRNNGEYIGTFFFFFLLLNSQLMRSWTWTSVTQQEIVPLYQRFCQLYCNAKGFISGDEFMSVPEFAMNPLPQVFASSKPKDGGRSSS
ncbi:calcineurin subunit B-like isoform X2 [Tripterygium wilfordii]|uniref:Calcineurin subunit B-like isoform X2 n=1 Tax=Tripterygium wilfordii TaxID=458696 RepID=A0A7J7BYH8_TRIWF|nr:calcineurin subunit B-like isoform X2 [Tripterygium wilfordii]